MRARSETTICAGEIDRVGLHSQQEPGGLIVKRSSDGLQGHPTTYTFNGGCLRGKHLGDASEILADLETSVLR
jgi:hypothetical protein